MTDKTTKRSSNLDDIAKNAAENTTALNPIVALRSEDFVAAGTNLMRAMAANPTLVANKWMSFMGEMGQILSNTSEIAPDPKDRRFADPAWGTDRINKTMMQTYLAWSKNVETLVEEMDLPDRDAARARLVSSLWVDAVAPSNGLLTNPTARKQVVETNGKSVVDGFMNFFEDITKNGGLPSSVDKSKFKVGENLAISKGDVVFRNDVLEIIHYTASTDKVYRRPLLIVPPQINKYYSVDMAPGKSMIEFLLANGIQPYCVSWRNPTAKQREWSMETYIEALDEACDATLDITGSDSVNIMGSCSGGITLSTYVGWLAHNKKSDKINSIILAVCVLDTMADTGSDMAALVTPGTIEAAKQMSDTQGILDGEDMAKMFAWMRPNDLVWNYWVNNYLMGNQPPAFDVLYWNADTTRLPKGLHHDFLNMIYSNPFMDKGVSKIGDVTVDMSKVKHDTYVIAGTTDHITPWTGVYETARLFGPKTTFILSNSGHLQSLLNPPGNPKSWYLKAPAKQDTPEAWAEAAKKNEGSWWLDWADMLQKKSGNKINAPDTPGNATFPSLGPAPGTYVFEP